MVEGMSDAANLPPITPSVATPEHRAAAPRAVRAAIVTISDTRTPETDTSGNYLRNELLSAGHEVIEHSIVKDDAVEIRTVLTRLIRDADIVLTSGGTGISGRDVTIPVVESLLVKPMPGFGEIFRMLSYDHVGGAAMLSRATGGLTRGALIFAMPGSLNAVQTAWEGILKDELGHLVFEVLRQHQPQQVGPEALRPAASLHPEQGQQSHINQGAASGIGRHAKATGTAMPSRYDPED